RCRQQVVVTLIEEHRRVSLPFAPSDDRGESGFRIVNPTGRGHQRGAIAGKPDRGVTLPGSDRYRDPTSSQRAHEAEIADDAGERLVARVETCPHSSLSRTSS